MSAIWGGTGVGGGAVREAAASNGCLVKAGPHPLSCSEAAQFPPPHLSPTTSPEQGRGLRWPRGATGLVLAWAQGHSGQRSPGSSAPGTYPVRVLSPPRCWEQCNLKRLVAWKASSSSGRAMALPLGLPVTGERGCDRCRSHGRDSDQGAPTWSEPGPASSMFWDLGRISAAGTAKGGDGEEPCGPASFPLLPESGWMHQPPSQNFPESYGHSCP